MLLLTTLPGISQAFLMVNLPPSLVKLRFPNFVFKVKLGVLLLCLLFLLDYQPTLGFPPVKKNIVFAEVAQEQTVNPQQAAVSFQLPHPGYITTHFSNYHPGIDLCAGLGFPIKPVAKGTVVEAGYNFFGLGLMVEVEHEGGYRSLYGHMGKIFVQKGQMVDVNDYLGEIGMTGHTSGPHTHLEISKDGKKIDPLLVLPEIRSYPTEDDFVAVKSATPSAVAIPSYKPIASESAAIKQTTTPLPSPVIKEETKNILNNELSKTTDVKNDLIKKPVENIINLASPLPSSKPLPQGGALSLRNFSLFGIKK